MTLDVENDRMASCGHVSLQNFASILNIEYDQMALSALNEVFKISALILNVEDDEFGSTRLSCLVFSSCFT